MVIIMNKIEIKKIDEHYYHKLLSNGLNIYIYKSNNTNEYKVSFFTKYGSIYNDFKVKDEKHFKNYPLGIAHFLEHKLFESETKEEPMEYFAKTGTSSNAYTSFFQTCYYIEGSKNYEDNLNFLIDFVQKPYFTTETVNKEKGIIEQELNMYNDNPNHVLFYRTLFNMMHNHPIKYDIGGTKESINMITKDMLYDCYNTFYAPNNMTIVVTGDVDIKETINIIEKNQLNKNISNNTYELNKTKEPKHVLKTNDKINMNVNMPLISLGIKIPINFQMDKEQLDAYMNTIVEENFGKKSDFYTDALEREIISSTLYITQIQIEEYCLIILDAKSNKPKELIEEIKSKLNKLNITENFFNRQKKNYISNIIYAFENHLSVNTLIENYIVDYGKTLENLYTDTLNLNYEDLNKVFNNLDINNTSSVIISKSV